MKSQITHLLLTLFIILLIYCIMYYFIYKPKPTEIKFDTDDNYYYDYKNSNNHLHSKMQKPEVFYDITQDEATKNVNDLYKLQTYLQTYKDNYLLQINPIINDTKIELSNQGKNISKLITERYILQFLDSINKANAVAYGEFYKCKKNEKLNILPNKSSHMKK